MATGEIISWQSRFQFLASNTSDDRIKNFYCDGLADPNKTLAESEFVALDFETTGLDASTDDIVSIGAIPFTLNRIKCAQAKHWLLKPNGPLADESVVLHRITHSQVASAPDFNDVLSELLSMLASKVIVVHYQSIEKHFFDSALKARLGEGIEFPVIDTMSVEVKAIKRARSWLDTLTRKPLPSVRLGDCRLRYGLPYYQPHHALSDALATAELFQAQVQYSLQPDSLVKQLWE
ncbi:3'-5' exonuclease [Pseudoalteromonas sp. T1lg65]|uniref:3'-5' exonuclease n=1 Tax=Pseudoalteromonas sp. T1lg65 TaxID=2077101 RepID=UPI003F791868